MFIFRYSILVLAIADAISVLMNQRIIEYRKTNIEHRKD